MIFTSTLPTNRTSTPDSDLVLGSDYNSVDVFDHDEEATELYLSLMTGEKSASNLTTSQEFTPNLFPLHGSEDLEPSPIDYSSLSSNSSCNDNSSYLSESSEYPRNTMSTVRTATAKVATISANPSWAQAQAPSRNIAPDQQSNKIQVPVGADPFSNLPPQPGVVNVYLIVDPLRKTASIPRQSLHYQNRTYEMDDTELPLFPDKSIFTKRIIHPQEPHDSISPAHSEAEAQQISFPQQPPTLSSEEETSSISTNVTSSGKLNETCLTPLRALSAYNYFFRDERERLLQDPDARDTVVRDLTPARQHKLLLEHWNRDRTLKRVHCRSHGKISFHELSKRISSSWRRMKADQKAFYKEISTKDWDRYHQEKLANTMFALLNDKFVQVAG